MADEIWSAGPRFTISKDAFPIGTDGVLLSSFTDVRGASRCCDIGCGCGIIGIMLAHKNSSLRVDGIELSEKAAAVCNENVELNGMGDRFQVICADASSLRGAAYAGVYDLVVSNPPYYPVGGGYPASDSAKNARGEHTLTLEALAETAAYFTRYGGKFAVVHKPERLAELMRCLSEKMLEPKRLRLVQYSPQSEPNLVLLECRRGGKVGLKVERPLIMTINGEDSPEISEIYHRGQKI